MKTMRLIIVVCTAMTLASCAVPDPMFLANSRNIQDIEYPETKIVGTWVHVSIAPVQTDQVAIERKVYLDIYATGRGRVREAVKNKANGGRLSAEAQLKWKYLGNNQWKITLPGSDHYRVTDSYLLRMDPAQNKGAGDVLVRYYNGNLYDFQSQRVLVKATVENVSQLANRMRSQTPVLHLDTNRKWR